MSQRLPPVAAAAVLVTALTLLSYALPASAHGGLPRSVAVPEGQPMPQVGQSPWGPEDELGRLNLITPASQAAVLSRLDARAVYDLSVEYFMGMPSWQAVDDPRYQLWMTHTPAGTVVDDPMGVGEQQNLHISYTGSAISMYTHMGTHIDALNHFGLNGKIWNGFDAREHLGDRGWKKTGAETIPPLIARGVLIDVAAARGLDMLPPGYRVRKADLQAALTKQGLTLQQGDVVLIRTGRMKLYEKPQAYMDNAPGMSLDAARFLVEESGAMVVGADNLSFEAFPSEVEGNYIPVHTYLLAQQGAPILELVNLEALSRDRVYEFAFIGASLKLRGADAAPLRPVAIPLRR
jgi:kynurenine formamidase